MTNKPTIVVREFYSFGQVYYRPECPLSRSLKLLNQKTNSFSKRDLEILEALVTIEVITKPLTNRTIRRRERINEVISLVSTNSKFGPDKFRPKPAHESLQPIDDSEPQLILCWRPKTFNTDNSKSKFLFEVKTPELLESIKMAIAVKNDRITVDGAITLASLLKNPVTIENLRQCVGEIKDLDKLRLIVGSEVVDSFSFIEGSLDKETRSQLHIKLGDLL